jgi:erythromycin esterase
MRTRLLLVFTILLVLAGASASFQRSAEVPAYAHPIQSLDAPGFADLEFLRPILAGVRIVQLGENGHGAAEPMRLRARLARFLHREMGFSVLAFESSLFLCHLADVTAAETEPRATLTRSLVGVWHTEEVLPLFAHMKESRAGTARLRLAGFDVQPIGSRKKERPAFLARLVSAIDATYGREVETLDATFVAEYDNGASSRRAYLRRT